LLTTWFDQFDREREHKYQQLSQQIAKAIRTGELSPGTRLPSYRDFAYQLGISIGSVAHAY